MGNVAQFDYSESQADADDLLAEFGQMGAIQRAAAAPQQNPTPWDPTDDATSDPETYACRLVVLPIDAKDVDGTLINASSVQILVSAVGLPIMPDTTDTVVTADGTYTLTNCKTLAPAGVAVLHDIVADR